jgi:hypothetical protein
MDAAITHGVRDPVVLSAVGREVSAEAWTTLVGAPDAPSRSAYPHDCQPFEFLQVRKSIKFMSRQDRLAVSAAGKTLAAAGLEPGHDCSTVSLFLCVGYIPFEREEAELLCALSQADGRLSMDVFSTQAYASINPIRAFTCLPNMPAHHVAVNFGIQGEYFLTYPGTPQFYLALNEACQRLEDGSAQLALVGGVADQANFLVAHHHQKMCPGAPVCLADAAAFVLLELESAARSAGRGPLCRLEVSADGAWQDSNGAGQSGAVELGAAELPLRVAAFLAGSEAVFDHTCSAGRRFRSSWARVSAQPAGES